MKVLVTGSTGFFGKAIASRLKQTGHEVIGAARSSNLWQKRPCRALSNAYLTQSA